MPKKPKKPPFEPDVCVFVKTYGESWARWDKPFNEVVQAMTERKATESPKVEPTVVVEVQAIRKARIFTTVEVEHYLNQGGEEVLLIDGSDG